MALWGTVGGLCYAYAVEALVADPGSLPGGLVAAWFDNWWWLPGLALPLGALLLLMPDGHLASAGGGPSPLPSRSERYSGPLAVSTSPTFDLGTATPIENPLARAGGTHGRCGRDRRCDPRHRRPGRVTRGLHRPLPALRRRRAAAVALGRRFAWPRRTALRRRCSLVGRCPGCRVVAGAGVPRLPTGIAVAVLKYRLYEIDLVINRALVYGVMTIGVVASYVAIVGLVGATLSSRGDLFVSLVVTGVVAVCFQPLRERVQRFVNRLMYGERDDPYTAIARLGRTLASSLQLDTVLPTIVETIGQTLALQYVGLALAAKALHGKLRSPPNTARPGTDLLDAPARPPGRRRRGTPARTAARRAPSGARPPPDRRPCTPGRRRRPRSRALAGAAVGATAHRRSFAKRSGDASAATSTTGSGLPWPGSRSHSRPSATSPARISSAPTNSSSRPPSRCRR